MSGRLIYVVGPSGAGKDSLLQWVKARLPEDARIHFARRTITRPSSVDAEQHEAVGESRFAQLVTDRVFAMHWSANGLSYGIRHDELNPLQRGDSVVVNGSREYADEALRRYPSLSLIHITASEAVLRSRLAQRGRESAEATNARMGRSASLSLSNEQRERATEICNDGALEEAGQTLLLQVMSRA
jgi:ribose 1,5-bisphosphokinase